MPDELKEIGKAVASIALAASFLFPPAAAVTVPLTIITATTSAAAVVVGHATNNDEMKEAGMDLFDVAGGAILQDPTGSVQGSIESTFSSRRKK